MARERSPGEITRLLASWTEDDASRERLMELVYPELRRVARRRLRPDATLDPTEVVNETYLRLVRQVRTVWVDRVHFFALCARLMRRLLTERARNRSRRKRGGDRERTTLAGLAGEGPREVDLLDLDRALDRLTEIDPDMARTVELLYFGGLTQEEAAEALGVSRPTVARRWAAARAWLWSTLRDA